MKEWADFFVAVAGAAAALTGLIFVGVSISLTKILSIRGLPDRALLSLVLLINVLVVSLLFLVPVQTTKALGTEILIIGILTWGTVLRLDLRNVFNGEKQHKLQRLFNLLIDQIATACFIIAGVAMAVDWLAGIFWILPAIFFSIVKAVFDGWALLVEINR